MNLRDTRNNLKESKNLRDSNMRIIHKLSTQDMKI